MNLRRNDIAPRPADVIVWLDLGKGIYYSKRQRRYAAASPEVCVPAGSSAAAIAARCSGCDKAPISRSVKWAT
jgi:hypothetical protein